MSRPAACSVRGLTVAYRSEPVLLDAGLEVPEGSATGLVGPNGGGKSTLVKAALGIVHPVRGEARFWGEPLHRVRHRIAYMPQTSSIDWDFPTTVRDVVTMGATVGLAWYRPAGRRHREQAERALAEVGMSGFERRQIGELSGGQRQRVLLARALAGSPDLCILDEPFQGVDAGSQEAILAVLRRLREEGRTVLMVHHDLAMVREHCDRAVLVRGRVVAEGPADRVLTAEHVREAYELGGGEAAFLASLR